MSGIYEVIFKSFSQTVDAIEEGEVAEIDAAYHRTLGLLEGLELTAKNCDDRFHDARILLENIRAGLYDGYEMRIMLERIFKDCAYAENEIRAITVLSRALLAYWDAVGDEKICAICAFKATVNALITLNYAVDYEKFCELLSEDSPVEISILEARRRVCRVYKIHRYETHRCVDRRDSQNLKTADELAQETAGLWAKWKKNHDTQARDEFFKRYRQIAGAHIFSSEIQFLEKKDLDELEYMVEAAKLFERWGYRKF